MTSDEHVCEMESALAARDHQLANLASLLVDARNENIQLRQTIHLYLPVQYWPDTNPIAYEVNG